ncbi:alpha-ketoglutarate-dependent dioxygenase AlkB family protein [Undibacterium fentianense]|uniref:Alpha-ketoglutarate-dependent dioxygenase AlkB n=1 Tax=Undibacterium fentianense TaxID=2828728 RepID=A0A941E156_9BURK|nr:alpha-ketoglutarate-dependent dioxygenase AlkB [Undibacterium fentianense]MBR7801324.1 alpha-ketoglutarate-dependent dioxygenase AlkB [Undibacterium fentianense]
MQQSSLFDKPDISEILSLPDAKIQYFPHCYTKPEADQLYQQLQQEIPWRHEQIRIAGIVRLQPRLSAWFGDADATYTYSGLKLQPLAWSSVLLQIKEKLEDTCHTAFNSVLLNYYRDHQDSMGWHSDDEKELGAQPVIASLTLGEERLFQLKHKHRPELRYKIPLAHGSLLVMAGETQHHWLHAIAKEKSHISGRINLTFRRILK